MSQLKALQGPEPAAEEDVRRCPAQRRLAEGSDVKKMLRPSQRLKMAGEVVEAGRTSIPHVCQMFVVSETCLRYQAKSWRVRGAPRSR